ncbi:MAG TPA: DegT/DnrJ/EryC1/StrS family aminotransferase [Rhizomicrobium sp.]|jgi:perosamine synthetase|nr:DegT/DnrJ/EryC1/StrS family aminotransferase [Rhizomicrobium sp.]
MKARFLPIFEPSLAGNERKYLLEAIDTSWISSQGPFISRFEQDFAAYHGVPYAVACSNCTTALHMALLVAGIGRGDEVLCPDLTFISPVNMVLLTGATPVLVDIEPDGFNIDPTLIEARITPRTKAVIVVHQFGHAADMDAICAIARKHDLAVIEDVAEAIGARYKGRMLGTIGDLACYSLFGNKIITSGEGGMVITSNPTYDRKLRVLRDHGMTPGKKYHHEVPGFNYRLTNLQAAVGLGQLERLDEILRERARISDWYEKRLSNISGLRWRPNLDYSSSVFWLATVTLDNEEWRAPLMDHLRQAGIEPRPMIFPVHFAPYLGIDCDAADYPMSRSISLRSVHLPSSTNLTEADVDRVCEAVITWIRHQ